MILTYLQEYPHTHRQPICDCRAGFFSQELLYAFLSCVSPDLSTWFSDGGVQVALEYKVLQFKYSTWPQT